MYTVNTDGGSRGNPGPSGCAFVVANAGKIVETGKFFLGKMTNNQAEYIGAMLGILAAQKSGVKEVFWSMKMESHCP